MSNKPIFLKSRSNIEEYINQLSEMQKVAKGKVKEKIDLELKLATLGQIGENNIAFELKNSGIPMYILHDIYLETEGLTAQIDYIVITKKMNFIIECKNLIGNIFIDAEGNFIREYQLGNKKIKEGFYSPITQNERHMEVLKRIRKQFKSNFLTKHLFEKNFNNNYNSIVVLANPKTIINDRYAKKEIKEKVIRADQLVRYIKDINNNPDLVSISDKRMEELAHEILVMHNPNNTDYTKKFQNLKDTERDEKIENDSINEEELKGKLKTFRLQRSKEENIKPYIIFTDKQMMNLIDIMPRTKQELKTVSGFGDIKVEKYGDEIIKIINSN